ncbi:MAG: metal ABC transporter permease [Planctomycetia bacterium]|nr:metal ABC transporter permease [Planctomycetia bacterium]
MHLSLFFSPEYGFLRLAFLLSAIASISFGLIGSFVVVRRIGYLAGAISHCAFGGIGFGLWLKQTIAAGGLGIYFFCKDPERLESWGESIDPVIAATFAAVFAAFIIGLVRKIGTEREDTLIGILWSVGMAIGLLFLDRTAGYLSVTSYLFGDITFVSWNDIRTVALLAALVLVLTILFFKKLEAVCFDEEFARLRNISVEFYFQMLLILTALTVVLMLRVVGMVLVIALLTIPAATASLLTKKLGSMIFLSIFFCFLGSWTGIYLSLLLNFSSGPMIIAVVAAVYFLVAFGRLVCRKRFCQNSKEAS